MLRLESGSDTALPAGDTADTGRTPKCGQGGSCGGFACNLETRDAVYHHLSAPTGYLRLSRSRLLRSAVTLDELVSSVEL